MTRAPIIVAFVAALTSNVSAVVQPAAITTLPSTWQEFVNHFIEGGDLGAWTTQGKTEAMWEGIPAGLDYSNVEESWLADDGQTIQRKHLMQTDDGRVISTGAGVYYWDTKTGTVKASYSGFDTGEPFWGTSTLLGLHENGERWEYVERSRGKTTTYLTEQKRSGTNERTSTVRKADGGAPWMTVLERVNPMADVTRRFDIAGRWETMLPDGSRRVTTLTPSLDGRIIQGVEQMVRSDGSSEQRATTSMYWDAGRDTVCFLYLNSAGMCVTGELVSLTVKGNTATMVSRHHGYDANGHAMAVTLTRVIEGDSLTSTFTDFSSETIKVTPEWARVPTTATRTRRY